MAYTENMRKRPVQISILIIVIIGAAAGFLMLNSGKNESNSTATSKSSETAAVQPQQANATSAQAAVQQPGSYVAYSSGALANTAGTKLLFFHAPWCPQCRSLDGDIKKNGVPNAVTIFKIDYDSNQQLRQKYGVTIQTTVVRVDDQGNLVDKYVAYDDPSLQAVLRNLL